MKIAFSAMKHSQLHVSYLQLMGWIKRNVKSKLFKGWAKKSNPQILYTLDDFQSSFTVTFSRKFAIK